MKSWSPLWSTIVYSSLWDETSECVKLFITMMALKDHDHVCRYNAYQLAQVSKLSEIKVLEYLQVLSSPDTKRVEHQEFEGRRIQAVEEGFLILNGEKYRKQVQIEMKRARDRRAQAAKRERDKLGPSKLLDGEAVHERAIKNGQTREETDQIGESYLPKKLHNGEPQAQ
jgi:hypothetical protein